MQNIFSLFMLVGDKRSYVLTRTIGFLSTCEPLLLNIKTLILYNALTEMYINVKELEPKYPNLFNT